MSSERYNLPPVLDRIEGAAALKTYYGYFPKFHDAKVVSLSRSGASPILEMTIHAYRITDALDERGYYILDMHTLVTITFGDIRKMVPEYPRESNLIHSLGFTAIDGGLINCTLDDTYGESTEITAAEVSIRFCPAYADGTPIPPPPR